MAERGLVNESTLTDIANAIRSKLESTDTMLPSEMAALISGMKNVRIKQGSLTTSNQVNESNLNITVTHDLGVVPQAIIFYATKAQYNTFSDGVLAVASILCSKSHGLRIYKSSNVTNNSSTLTFDSNSTNLSKLWQWNAASSTYYDVYPYNIDAWTFHVPRKLAGGTLHHWIVISEALK